MNIIFLWLDKRENLRQIGGVRAHGMWTYESRQGRKAATAVCSASAVVTLTFFLTTLFIYHLRWAVLDLVLPQKLQSYARCGSIVN